MKTGSWIASLGISTYATPLAWHFSTVNVIYCGQTPEDITNNGNFNSVRKIRVYSIIFRVRKFEVRISLIFYWS